MRRNSFVQAALTGRIGVRLSGGGAAAFTGAYDAIPSISAAYGMRRLRSAYTGNILRLRRASDNAELDFGYTASGDLDTAAIATWLTATTGYVTTWYDQSGNANNATQATAASQPLYVASGQNGKPVVSFDGVGDALSSAAILTQYSVSLAWYPVAFATGFAISVSLSSGSGSAMGVRESGKYYDNENGVSAIEATANVTLGSWYTLQSIQSASVKTVYRNNAEVATAEGSPSGTSTIVMGSNGLFSYFNLRIAELVIANTAWSSGNRSAAETAANAYWSIY